MPLVRTAQQQREYEELRDRRPSPVSSVPQSPAAAPKVDPFQAEAARAEALLAPLDEVALLSLTNTPEQVKELAVEAALQELRLAYPGLSATEVATLRTRLQGRN